MFKEHCRTINNYNRKFPRTNSILKLNRVVKNGPWSYSSWPILKFPKITIVLKRIQMSILMINLGNFAKNLQENFVYQENTKEVFHNPDLKVLRMCIVSGTTPGEKWGCFWFERLFTKRNVNEVDGTNQYIMSGHDI